MDPLILLAFPPIDLIKFVPPLYVTGLVPLRLLKWFSNVISFI